jgi:hypothetical protein
MKNKKKLIEALQTIYDILDEEDHDDVESLYEIEELIKNLKAKPSLFPEMSAEEVIKLITWKMRVGSAFLLESNIAVGDEVHSNNGVVRIGNQLIQAIGTEI